MSDVQLKEPPIQTEQKKLSPQVDKAFLDALKEISGDRDDYTGFDAGPRRDIGPRTV
ncbi:hypothetical protein DFR48_107209 [Ciceribacter lividus]|uniref:Uncharacterized protein n=1 Tax=Ciceribacter lividus TaxID=1197950 RepID=A0A6I7HK78_9HYPH|nr:hypothetical protein [Ciceribacter lividus]RCW23337.1 hypothetical protein DFR48_107209 [Ciceribacter lividus]